PSDHLLCLAFGLVLSPPCLQRGVTGQLSGSRLHPALCLVNLSFSLVASSFGHVHLLSRTGQQKMLNPPGPMISPTTMSTIPATTPPRTRVTIPAITKIAAMIQRIV